MTQDREQTERGIILTLLHKRPYGISLRCHFQTSGDLGNLGKVEEESLDLASGAVLTVRPMDTEPWDGGVSRQISVVGFPTATAAEAAGQRLTQAMLALAIGLAVPLKLVYETHEPVRVFDRTRGPSMSATAFGEVTKSRDRILAYLRDTLSQPQEPLDPAVLLSMELFCAAPFQASVTATFYAMVSALEPLADTGSKNSATVAFLKQCVAEMEQNETIPADDKNALRGSFVHMEQESVGQSLRRLVKRVLPDDPDAPKFVSTVYGWRSQLTHKGRLDDPDVELRTEVQRLSQWMRRLYGRLLPHPEPGTPK